MKFLKSIILWLFLIMPFLVRTQETLPIYSDYLSDNIFLIHPSAAGIGNCGKIRFTARNQWSGVQDAPTLQTLTAHQRFGEKIGAGVILFNDKNGYHSQQGFEAVFAYHINLLGYDGANQLSFALGFLAMNNKLDESSFDPSDPIISGIVQSGSYFNGDFSMAYHSKGLFGYFSVKNLIVTTSESYDSYYESLNLRRYLLTAGYYFGNEKSFQFEPSVMGQLVERTGELFMDFNIKVYKNISNAQIWAALSYRQGFDNAVDQELQYLTPIIGINFNQFMFSYTYTKQTGDILFDDAGYHQITLGYNFGCKTRNNFNWRYHPNLYLPY
jgi:type IX secretion system PorP/SprF family membrane protein